MLFGVGPDLIHLETTLGRYRPFWFYHPPLPVRRLDVADENGVIREVRIFAATPPEIELPMNQFPPETTHGEDGPVRLYPIPPHMLPLLNDPPRFRPHPPLGAVHAPPIHAPGYIPVPPGIRAAYTDPVVFLRAKSEMNHHPRALPTAVARRPGESPTLDPEEIMRRWAVALDGRPEINLIS